MSNSRLLDGHLNNNICPDLKKGDRVILINMSDPISPLPTKSRGTVLKDGVNFVDETIYSIRWDKSGSLNILSNIDRLKELDEKIERSNNESDIERYKGEIKNIEKDHDVWMLEGDYDNLKTKKKSSINENHKNVINILKQNKNKFKNYDVPKLIKYLTAVRDAGFTNMLQASYFLICGEERAEHETRYSNKTNKKAYQYVLDNAGEVRDIMIRGAMESLEETNKEITPESVERLMRRDAQQFLLLYMTLPIKKHDYPEYDDIEDEEDYYEDGYDDDESEDLYENLKTKKKSSINENLVDEKKIYKIIEKVGPFKAATYFGGVEKFLKLLETIPGTDSIKEQFKGSCSVPYIGEESYPDAYFDFHILDYNIMDDDFVELIVDILVDFSNLSGEEIYNLKKWFGAVADDFGFEIYDVENLPSHQNLYIKSFNGKPYTWPGYDIISDDEAFELLDKTGKWEGLIRESIHVFKNPKTDEDSGFKTMVAVIKRLEDKPGNPYTDYTDLHPRMKIKFLESDEWGIKVYIDIESMGESDEEFEVFTNYGDETRRHMTNRNLMKFWHGYKLNDDEDDTHPSFKTIIYNRLIKLRNNIGLKSKLRVSILP